MSPIVRRTPEERRAYMQGLDAGVHYMLKIVEDPAIEPLDAAELRREAERFLAAVATASSTQDGGQA